MAPAKSPELRLADFLPYRLSVAANAVSQVVARAYRETHGLSTPQWRVMAVLAAGGALTQQHLARRTRMDKVTVSRAARELAARELVQRVRSDSDGRSLRLTLTAGGRRVYRAIVPAALEAQKVVLDGLRADERRQLLELLQRLERAAEQALGVEE